MRLYSRTGAVALDDPEFGHFDADDNDAFDFPEPLSDRLHRFHVNGAPLWESDAERQQRTAAEDRARAQDPAVMHSLMQRLVELTEANAGTAAAEKPAAKRTTRAKSSSTD